MGGGGGGSDGRRRDGSQIMQGALLILNTVIHNISPF